MDSRIGKTVGQRLYVHASALDRVDEDRSGSLQEAERLVGLADSQRYNVIRFEPDASQVALLHYSEFFEGPSPTLQESWRVNLAARRSG
jgi:hypothetical protein